MSNTTDIPGGIEKINDVLGCCYIFLGVLSIVQVITKYKVERKVKTSVVFPAEILFLCLVRASYFFSSLTTWSNLNTPTYEHAYTLFIDTFPELIFVAIYVLLVSSWGVTWAKARRARPFAPYQFWLFYSCTVASTFLIAVVLSVVAQQMHISYDHALLWEAAYLVTLSFVCVLAALIFGLKLYCMLGKSACKSKYLSQMMRQLLFLVVLATISFVIKGVWVFSISTYVRNKWVSHQWSDIKFGIFWISYYALTELIPFIVVWTVLQWKETATKEPYKSGTKLGGKTNHGQTTTTTAAATTTTSSPDLELFPQQGTKFVPLSEESEYSYQNADELDHL